MKNFKLSNERVDVAVLLEKVETIKLDVAEIKQRLEHDYVTEQEFQPIRNIVYGMVSLVLITVFGALLVLVVRK